MQTTQVVVSTAPLTVEELANPESQPGFIASGQYRTNSQKKTMIQSIIGYSHANDSCIVHINDGSGWEQVPWVQFASS